jgi:pimeloyl-ACP methyl ester carboxylesterase
MLDLKGFGLSSKPDDHLYSPDEQAHIVASFVEHLGLNDFVLVGHSYGAGISLLAYRNLLSTHRQRPKALVLIDAAVYPQDLPFFVSNLRRPLLNRLILNATSASFRARYTLTRVFRIQAAVTDDRVERYARFLDLPGSHGSFITAAKQIDAIDPEVVPAIAKSVDVPTLILWGSEDPVIPLTNGRRLATDIASSRLEVVQGAGHVPHEERPDITARLIVQFLKGL